MQGRRLVEIEQYSVEAYLKATGVDKFSDAFRSATKNVEGLENSSGKAGLTIGKLIGAVGVTAALSKGFNMVKDSVSRAFGRIDTMEQFERVMTTLTGSSEKAGQVLDEVSEKVTGTAYGLDVGAKAVQGFVTSNMEVDKATQTFGAWADAVAFYGDGTNATLGSVTDALAKATAKGKIQMDTMNRLAEAGIPAMQIYADATGKSVEDVADAMSKGKIRADEFHKVMNDAMMNGTKNFKSIDGAAKEAGASWTGSFDNMKAAVTRGTIAIIQNIDDMLQDNGLPQMRDMVADFGKKFETGLKKAADAIPVLVDKAKEVYQTIEPWIPLIKNIILVVGSFVGAFAVMNTVRNIILGVRTAVLAMNAAFLANPIGLIVAAIVAAAALIYIYWDPISEFFVKLWDKIKNVWASVADWFSDAWQSTVYWFKGLWDGLVSFLKEWGIVILGLLTGPVGLAAALIYKYWDPIKEFFANLWDAIKTKATEVWNSIVTTASAVWTTFVEVVMSIIQPFIDSFMLIWNNVKDGLAQIWEGVKEYFVALWEIIKNIFLGAILLLVNLVTGNFEGLKTDAVAIWENIKQALSDAWEAIKKVFSGALDVIQGYISAAWEIIKNTTSTVYNGILSFLTSLWNGIRLIFNNVIDFIVNFVKQRWTNLKNNTSSAFNAVKTLISSIWNGIKTFFTQTLVNIYNTVIQKFNKVKQAAKDKMNEAKDNIKNAWDAAVKFLKSIDLLQIGKEVIQGFINGIKSMVGAVGDAAKSAADAVTSKIKSILKIASPSKILDKFGTWTGQGFVGGLLDMVKYVKRAAEELGLAAIPDIEPLDIAGNVAGINAQVSRQFDVNHTNQNDGRMIALLEKIANSNQVIVLDTGELVGGTYREYDRVGGSQLELTERWGR